jgi:hypothetical protein
MKLQNWLVAAVAGAVIGVTGTSAYAQEPASSLGDAASRVDAGARLEIVTTDGSVVSGRLVRWSELGLAVSVDGRAVEIPANRVSQITKRGDSLRNGTTVGLAVGALSGMAWGALWNSVLTESDDLASAQRRWPVQILTGAGIGAGTGALIDAMRDGKTVVFRSDRRTATVVPMLGRHLRGVALTLRF